LPRASLANSEEQRVKTAIPFPKITQPFSQKGIGHFPKRPVRFLRKGCVIFCKAIDQVEKFQLSGKIITGLQSTDYTQTL